MVGMFGTRNGEGQYVMMLQSQLLGCCSHCPQIGTTSKHEYIALPTWNGIHVHLLCFHFPVDPVYPQLCSLLRLTRGEASADSRVSKDQRVLEGLLQGAKGWGLPQQVLATVGCIRRFKGLNKERTLKSSTETQRDPRDPGRIE